MLWQIALPGGVVPFLRRPSAEIREGWLEGPGGAARSAALASRSVAEVVP